MSLTWVFVFDRAKNFVAVDLLAALGNDGVADLSNENQEARGSVVVLRVGPDKQDGMHDGHEELSNFSQIKRSISEFVEVLFKCLKILVVFVSLKACSLHLFLELAESASLG